MKLNFYSIYDVATGAYMRPFLMPADAAAERAFKGLALDAEHDIGKHPEDYTLFKVGIFDDNTGQIIAFDPEKVVTALALVSASRNIKKDSLREFDTSLQEVN